MNTVLYQLTETSPFMMSFVIVTKQNRVIIVDGGRSEDMPLLKKIVDGRPVAAWFLTHAHIDHISGFINEFKQNGAADFDIDAIYYNFPPLNLTENPSVPWYDGFIREMELGELSPFYQILPLFQQKAHVVQCGNKIIIDECEIEILYTWHPFLTSNLLNDSSMVFRVQTPNKSVLFLGDLGPEGGDVLFSESREKLKSDIVQMAHHGHGCVSMEVYAEILPEACMWCCPDWLYDEEVDLPYFSESTSEELYNIRQIRMHGTKLTRKWMDLLGVRKHYVTKDGTNRIEL